MGLFGRTSRAATLNYDETYKLLCFLCTNNFRNFPVRAYLPLYELRFPSGFGSTAKKPSLKLFHEHSPGFSRGKIAPGTSSSFSFTFSCFFFFQFHLPFCILSCFNPAKTFHFVFGHVCLHSRPPNNPINVRVPSLGPRLSFLSELSYFVLAKTKNNK